MDASPLLNQACTCTPHVQSSQIFESGIIYKTIPKCLHIFNWNYENCWSTTHAVNHCSILLINAAQIIEKHSVAISFNSLFLIKMHM